MYDDLSSQLAAITCAVSHTGADYCSTCLPVWTPVTGCSASAAQLQPAPVCRPGTGGVNAGHPQSGHGHLGLEPDVRGPRHS